MTWSKLTLATAYMKGYPPSWRNSDQSMSSLKGTSMLTLLRWGDLGSSFIKALNQHQKPLSWSVEYAYLTLDDTSQYWGFSPHDSVMIPSPSSLSIFTIGGAQHIKLARHDLALSVVLSTDIKELMYWPEVKLTWRYESLSLSTLCGKPVSLPHLLAPNYWFSYCGVQLKIKTQIEI